MTVEVLLLAAITAAFGTLTVRSALRHRERPQPANRWISFVFAGLATASAGGFGLALSPDRPGADDDPLVLILLLVVGIVTYMGALYLFGAALSPVSRTSKLLVVATSLVLLLLIVGALLGSATSVPLQGLMISLLLLWSVVHAVVAIAVWSSGSRLTSRLARIRARNMMIGVLGMGAALLASFVPGMVGEPSDDEAQTIEGGEGSLAVPLGLAALAAVTLSAGFAPPRWLRRVWAQGDADRLVAAELALQRTPTPDVLCSRVLPEVCAITSGDAAWFLHDGRVVASAGIGPAEALSVTPTIDDEHFRTVRGDEGAWYLLAPAGRVCLVVRTADEPVVYGIGDLDGLVLVAARVGSILDRATLEEREAEARARLAEAEHLERVAALKDDVLSTLSHELRTPLVTLCGVSELLDARWDETSEGRRRELIGRVRANADELRRLVEETLDLASIRTGGASLSPRWVDVRSVVEAVLADSRLAGGRDTVVLDIEEGLGLTTDATALGRVLRQLLTNAVKFSPGGRPVTVRARSLEASVELQVVDHGAGMDATEVAQVFEPFYRGGHVLTRTTRGLGVGLALAHATVRQLGGRIEVESSPGAGSTFTVVLPRSGPG